MDGNTCGIYSGYGFQVYGISSDAWCTFSGYDYDDREPFRCEHFPITSYKISNLEKRDLKGALL